MFHRIPISKLALLVAVTPLLPLFIDQDADHPTKKTYVRTGYEAVISGSIVFTGKPPSRRTIDMSADPICYEVNSDPRTEDVMIREGMLQNVFVFVKGSALETYVFERPDSPVVLEHRGCRYNPHVLGIQVGQPLMILNSDPIQSNTHPTPRSNPEWNQTQPPGVPPLEKVFLRPETFIPFKSNQHPWQKAYVGVFPHPFFAISDTQGQYKIEGLPPGQYTVVAWHERFGEKTVEISVAPGEAQNISFTFDANDALPKPN